MIRWIRAISISVTVFIMDAKNLKSKSTGALLGTFVGDALGMPVEGWSPRRIASHFGKLNDLRAASLPIRFYSAIYGLLTDPAHALSEVRLGRGSYTDDTQMMIGVAESLVKSRGFDAADMAKRFTDNFDPRRGYGAGATEVIRQLQRGISWNEAGAKIFDGAGSFGNGAAMRVAPIGVLYHDDPAELRRAAELSASITHTHLLGKEGAVLQATAVACAVRGDLSADFLARMRALEPRCCQTFQRELTIIGELLQRQPTIAEVVRLLGNDITAYNSVPTAIYCFLSNPESFKDALIFAVSLGGDTDTIGAMTGAIAGAYHGVEAIPHDWLEALENGTKGRDYVRTLAERLSLCKP